MSKVGVDELVKNMKRARIVTKASPWMIEGFGEKEMNVRFVGVHLGEDWYEVFSEKDNLLLKFIIDRKSSYIEFYLANKPPFVRISSTRFTDNDKWEILLGELKRRLKKDKADIKNHTEKIGNLYKIIEPQLK